MRRAAIAALVVALLVPLLVVGAWQVDVAVAGERLQRGVGVGGRDLSRAERDEARSAVESLAVKFAARPVVVHAPGRSLRATAGDLGWTVDVDATVAAVARRTDDRGAAGFNGWLRSFVQERDLVPVLAIDEATVRGAVDRLDLDPGRTPVEPEVRLDAGRFLVVPGAPGRRIDADALVAALRRTPYGASAVTVSVPVVETTPSTPDSAAASVATALQARTSVPLPVQVGNAAVELDPDTLRSAVRPATSLDAVQVDRDALLTALSARVPDPITPAVPDTIAIVDGLPVATGGLPGTRCCDADAAAAAVREAIVAPTPPAAPVTVPPLLFAEGPPADLRSIGIVEEIARFTTPHRGGEPRVANIHLAADALRGRIFGPGEVLSLNEVLGERTAAKGYVAAPAIINGRLEPQIGGGVSQIATTLFNAAFFAGLDLVEYQSHSIYISRYPFAREATVFWPGLDLKVRNNTPGSILVWTEYTDTSITVVMYGTRTYATVEQGSQVRSPAGNCTAVRTERVKTRFDGTVEVDEVRARYRPGEGVSC